MRTISTDLKVWKDRQDRTQVLVTLYEIDVNDTTTFRLVEGDPDGTGEITYGGETYHACAIQREEYSENIEGDYPSFRLIVSNINGVAGGYIEQNELDGRQVTIRTGLLRGNEADYLVETYSINGASYDRKSAILQLGPPNFFQRKTCTRRFQRMRCQHSWAKRFEDVGWSGCGYPSDAFGREWRRGFSIGTIDEKAKPPYRVSFPANYEFTDDELDDFPSTGKSHGSGTDWKVGSRTNDEQERQFGWFTINALKCGQKFTDPGTLIVDSPSFPDQLMIGSSDNDLSWTPGSGLDAPFAYKKLTGDFDVHTRVRAYNFRAGFYAGLLCQSTANLQSWVFMGVAIDSGGETFVRGMAAEGGVLAPVYEINSVDYWWVRLVRSGLDFTCYYGPNNSTWTSLGTFTFSAFSTADIPTIRIGLCVSAGQMEQGLVLAGFGPFQFRSGGESTCERTREACRLKYNVHRYGAFPGIPRLR